MPRIPRLDRRTTQFAQLNDAARANGEPIHDPRVQVNQVIYPRRSNATRLQKGFEQFFRALPGAIAHRVVVWCRCCGQVSVRKVKIADCFPEPLPNHGVGVFSRTLEMKLVYVHAAAA